MDMFRNMSFYTDLFLVRHGLPLHYQAGKIQRKEARLSQVGLEQANQLAACLISLNEFTALYSSPLPRAFATAIPIAESLHQEPKVITDLREIDFGQAIDLSLDEFQQRWPDLAQLWGDPANFDFQWPGGESRKNFHRRSLVAIDTLVRSHRGESIIIVAHTGNLCGYLAHVFLGDAAHWRKFPLRCASISRVEICEKNANLLLLDDVSHLQGLGEDLRF